MIKRSVVSLAAVALYVALQHVWLPGVDRDVLAQWLELSSGSLFSLYCESPRMGISIGAVGLLSIMGAFILVEIGSLGRAKWRAARVDGGQGRQRLIRWSRGLALAFAVLQGFAIAVYLEQFSVSNQVVVAAPGWPFRLFIIIVVVAVTILLIAVAEVVDRAGLGAGLSVLTGAAVVVGWPQTVRSTFLLVQFGEVNLLQVLLLLFTAGFVMNSVWALGFSHQSSFGLPASGMVPLFGLAPLWALTHFHGIVWALVAVPFVACSGVLFGWLFHQPRRRAAVGLSHLNWMFFGLTVAVLLAWTVADSMLYVVHGSVFGLLVVAAVVQDLVAESFRRFQAEEDLVSVWDVHRVYAAAPAIEALALVNIPAFPQGLRHRALLQLPGAFIPIRILVPASLAERARAVLSGVLTTGGESG